jgi:hypothetical protein
MISKLLDIGWIIYCFFEFDALSNMFDGNLGSRFGAVPAIYLVYYSEVFWLHDFHI